MLSSNFSFSGKGNIKAQDLRLALNKVNNKLIKEIIE